MEDRGWTKTKTFKRWHRKVKHSRKTRRKSKSEKNMCLKKDFCKKTVHIPRSLMPQIYNPRDFSKKLKERYDIASTFTKVKAKDIWPSQNEINEDRVDDVIKDIKSGKISKAPIVISEDNYIVDGHHRWAAYKKYKPEKALSVLKVHLPIHDALGVASVIETKKEEF